MKNETANGTWLTGLRRVFPNLFRQRHVAVINQQRAAPPKLKPIAQILSDTGRDRGAQVD